MSGHINDDSSERGTRIVVDFKLPLWGILCASGVAVLMVIGLYFTVQALTEAVKELQVTVKAGNVALIAVSAENALQNYRLSAIEAELQRIVIQTRDTVKRSGS
jgi:hypothetical protein